MDASYPGASGPANRESRRRSRRVPADESPYGVNGLAGNSRDACLNDMGAELSGWRLFRGGAWSDTGRYSRAPLRFWGAPRDVAWFNGFRVGMSPSLPGTSRA